MALTMKNTVFWDVVPCHSRNNLHFRGMYHLHHQSDKNQLPGIANVLSSPIPFSLM
jgi:hypothetical protein